MAGKGYFPLLTFMAISRRLGSLASERAGSRGKGLKLKLTALSSRAGRKAVCRIREASFVSLPLAYGPRPRRWVDIPAGRGQARRKPNSRTDYHRSQGLQQLPLGVWFTDCNLFVLVATSRQL